MLSPGATSSEALLRIQRKARVRMKLLLFSTATRTAAAAGATTHAGGTATRTGIARLAGRRPGHTTPATWSLSLPHGGASRSWIARGAHSTS